jgi:hypothetical protein
MPGAGLRLGALAPWRVKARRPYGAEGSLPRPPSARDATLKTDPGGGLAP